MWETVTAVKIEQFVKTKDMQVVLDEFLLYIGNLDLLYRPVIGQR